MTAPPVAKPATPWRWATHALVLVAGLAAGYFLAPRGVESFSPGDDVPGPGAAKREPAPARPRAAVAPRDDSARIAELEAQVQTCRAEARQAEQERDEAVRRAGDRPPSLFELIDAVSPRDAVRAERRTREELQAARRNLIELHWHDVVGADVPRASRNDLQDCFSLFFAELRRTRTPDESRKLYEQFAHFFRERLEIPRRENASLRGRVSKADYPTSSAPIRAEIWRAGERLLDELGPLVHDEERTELRLRGSAALGIPEPLERLRLGWPQLLGDDVAAIAAESLELDDPAPFAWVYFNLERERSRDELRALHAKLKEAGDAAQGDIATVYESVKSLLTASEWRRLGCHPTRGNLPLSR